MRRFQIRANFFAISLVIFVSAMALVIGMLSQTVRRRLRHTIATHFYSHRYDYRREWAEFTTKVTAPDTVKAVPLRILEWVTDTLGTPSGAMWLVDQEHRWQLVAAVGLPEGAPVLGVDPPALLARVPQGRPVILRDGGLFPGDEARSLRERALPVLVPVVARDEILGLLAVGLPVGGPLTTEDEDLLTTAGAQAATVVLNARLSEQLARAREIEAFHKLSSFIVHDLKNAVAMLSLVAENARVHGENPEFRRDAFRTVEDSVGQMRALIGKLSRVPRQSGAVGGRADLNGVVEDVLVHARTAADGRVRIKDELEAAAGEVRVREEDLRAIVANLVLNALDATPANGEVHLRTSRHRETVTVMVADTGCGMSEAFIRESLFVPFRTTKKQGLGVGLFQVKTIVDGVGGSIRVESREGSGTTFCVNLPAAEPSREE
jgi:putative PEP-CTERM system histidine kinase